jgi:hypothetical protein
MPHANVANAAQHPQNLIIRPADLDGRGEYDISASVSVPAINILCVGMQQDELGPLLYNKSDGPRERDGATAVDKIFGFQESTKPYLPPPQFEKAPIAYNTFTNASTLIGPDSVYTLAAPPTSSPQTSDYVLCKMRAFLYPQCTTKMHVTHSGADLSVHCGDDRDNLLPYTYSVPDAPEAVAQPNWKELGLEVRLANSH